MTAAHVWLAWLSAALVVALLAVAIATATGRVRSYLALDRVLLAQGVIAGLTGAAGLASVVADGPPSDALHLLYGAVLAIVPAAARAAAHGREPEAVGRWVAVAAAVAVGATVRSFMTGS